MIISTHLISDIERILDEVIFIDNGEIKLVGSAEDLRAKHKQSIDEIVDSVITEKSMAMIQNSNQATFKVKPTANKAEVKLAFERLFKVKATHVSIINVRAKETTRGGRYPGKIQGYKKAIVTIKSGQAIDLFKE